MTFGWITRDCSVKLLPRGACTRYILFVLVLPHVHVTRVGSQLYIEFQPLSESAALHILELIPRLTSCSRKSERLLALFLLNIFRYENSIFERAKFACSELLSPFYYSHVAYVQNNSFNISVCFHTGFIARNHRFRNCLMYLYKFCKKNSSLTYTLT